MKTDRHAAILKDVDRYYSARLAEHGATPRGVDWNGDQSQELRFRQLSKVIVPDVRFSLNDIGCGYGALFDFLRRHHGAFDYHGSDISGDMVAEARARLGGFDNAHFVVEQTPSNEADYSVASGIFNVRLEHPDEEWLGYLQDTLDGISAVSKRGFAFNCLTSYSDREKMRSHLYYADPGGIFDLCKRRYSPHVALLHDYGLYEFTILVRKDA